MAKQFTYGSNEIRLNDDHDIAALIAALNEALDGGKGGWVNITGADAAHHVYVGQGIPMHIKTQDSSVYVY